MIQRVLDKISVIVKNSNRDIFTTFCRLKYFRHRIKYTAKYFVEKKGITLPHFNKIITKQIVYYNFFRLSNILLTKKKKIPWSIMILRYAENVLVFNTIKGYGK